MTKHDFEVVIPAYNAEATVLSAIRSAQHAGADRVIVVDDGSKDSTADVSLKAGAYVLHQPNAGASVARRRGIREVASNYVVMLDADDQLLREGVEASIEILAADTGLAAVAGAARGIRDDGSQEIIRSSDVRPTTKTLLVQGYAPVPPACIVWRAAILDEALNEGAPKPLLPRYAEDYEMLIRASILGGVSVHSMPAAVYAMQGGKSMVDPLRSVRSVAEMRQYYAKHLGISIPAWSERSIKARGALRMYKNAKSIPNRLRFLVVAALNDPRMISRILVARRVKK